MHTGEANIPEIKSPAQQTRGSKADLERLPFPQFSVENLRRVSYGRICARFDLEMGPIRLLDCNGLAGEDGHPKFVAPGAIKDAYSKTYRATVELDRPFREAIFDAVLERLVDDCRSESKPVAPTTSDAWARDQESRFEHAFDDLGGAA
jgi:hypothetical protein